MIGEKLYKNNKDDMARYTDTATWCNNNNAYIEDMGEYYEVFGNPAPSVDERILFLTTEYTKEKSNLCEAYTTATMTGDTETAQSVAADMAALDLWFDEEYRKIEEA